MKSTLVRRRMVEWGATSARYRQGRSLLHQRLAMPPTRRDPSRSVANGLAFNKKGDLFNIDTARGALWKVEFDRHGNLKSPTGCDTTFTANTLCLSNIFVAHPILEGGDGIALDREGNIWVDANERNAVAVVTKDRKVIEIFRNPVNLPPKPVVFGVGLRNAGDQSVGNNRILEFPTSPFLTGKVFCTSRSDGDRRDNSPRSRRGGQRWGRSQTHKSSWQNFLHGPGAKNSGSAIADRLKVLLTTQRLIKESIL